MQKIKYPKNEKLWVSYKDVSGDIKYIITSKHNRESYFLYEVKEGLCVKLGKARTPVSLIEKYKVKESLI